MSSKSIIQYALLTGALLASTSQARVMPSPGKDPTIMNEARIGYWLNKRLAKNKHSPEQLDSAVTQYKKRARVEVLPPEIAKAMSTAFDRRNQRVLADTMAKQQATKTVKVLAVLIDFPDLPNDDNRLTSADTDMYYSSYPVSHYDDMMFANKGYAGPNGENLKTVWQYYQQETNNQFFFTGKTYGWVTADNNSDYYGANDPDNNDDDIRPQDLIKEAVEKAVAQYNIDLADYDLEDPYDLDQDGVLNEPDGFIDHVNVFHSSIGEEAGGGTLGDNAIWSHRFFVNWTDSIQNAGYLIPGTDKKLLVYTIQPIDAAIGVVAHEFGHDLGLRDEYDTNNTGAGSPVGSWSIMSGGSWAGTLAGSEPTSFSPYARDLLTGWHGVAFANQQTISIDELSATPTNFELVDAVDHSAVNQLRLIIPGPAVQLGRPFAGDWQYHSGEGDNLNNSMKQTVAIPAGTSVTLKMRARFDIEKDRGYAQVMINGSAIAGNLTTATSPLAGTYPQYNGVVNYITDKSVNIAGADANGWVELTFDVSSWQGQSVELSFNYVTDTNTGEWGIVFDNLELIADGTSQWMDDAETAGTMTFAGYSRVNDTYEGKKRHYYVQVRSHRENDSGLPSHGYEHGVLLWLADPNYSDNNVSDHPGEGFIGVVDADQVMIGTRGTSTQIRDAVFSLYDQSAYSNDTHLSANSLFKDSDDYSAPGQPESGRKLPNLGIEMQVLNQANDSSSATIQLTKTDPAVIADFSTELSKRTLTLTNGSRVANGSVTYSWDFGDGTTSSEFEPGHEYTADGDFTITLTVTDSQQKSATHTQQISIDTAPTASFTLTQTGNTISVTNNSDGGMGGLTYSWDFGDGNTSTESAPSHTYANDGSYTVTLTVTDGESRTATMNQSVTINTAPPLSNNDGSSSSGGGGSFGWLFLSGLAWLSRRRAG